MGGIVIQACGNGAALHWLIYYDMVWVSMMVVWIT